jgi:hypothetical protein
MTYKRQKWTMSSAISICNKLHFLKTILIERKGAFTFHEWDLINKLFNVSDDFKETCKADKTYNAELIRSNGKIQELIRNKS